MPRIPRPNDPPEFSEDPRAVLLRLLVDTSRRSLAVPGAAGTMRHSLYEMLRPSTRSPAHRRQLWEAYELTEERTMVYLQVCTTDAREMACDNRHMTIPQRGESA